MIERHKSCSPLIALLVFVFLLMGASSLSTHTVQAASLKRSAPVPLYRLYSPGAIDHFYTTSAPEKDNAIHHLGYNDEGIAGYVSADSTTDLVKFYRLYSHGATDHFYTTNEQEANHAQQNLGYRHEGVMTWVLSSSAC